MKCPTCGIENPGSRKFCRECDTKLLSALLRCHLENLPGDILSGECRQDLTQPKETTALNYSEPRFYTQKFLVTKVLVSKSDLEGDRKQVTVLLADLKDSMDLMVDCNLKEAWNLLDLAVVRMLKFIHHYEGTVKLTAQTRWSNIMTIQAGVGVSTNRNPKVAGKEAARKALDVAKLERPDFVFMFATVGYPQKDILNAVRQATAQAPLCGCSGEGIIAQDITDESNFSVAVMVLKSDDLKFFHGLSAGLKADSEAVGRDMGRSLQHHIGDDTKALFVFGDGLTINFDSFQRGLRETISKGVNLPMFGGVSADNWAFKQTYQYCDDRVASDSVVWAMLRGKTSILSCVNHGCVPIGGKRTVTRAKGNVIYEIDGQPALEVLKEYLLPEEIDNWEKAVISLCLGFKTPAYLEGYDEYMIRFIPAKGQTKRPAGLLIAGNRSESAEYYARVQHESHLIVTLESFAAQVSSVLRNIHLYSELEKEKNSLEIRVMERTRELSEAKEATGSCSMAMEGFFCADRQGRIP